jgi:hypothetical protein
MNLCEITSLNRVNINKYYIYIYLYLFIFIYINGKMIKILVFDTEISGTPPRISNILPILTFEMPNY